MDNNKLGISVNTVLLGIITAGIISVIGFLWDLNKEIGKMQERDIIRTQTVNAIQSDIKSIQVDFNSLKERISVIEAREIGKK